MTTEPNEPTPAPVLAGRNPSREMSSTDASRAFVA